MRSQPRRQFQDVGVKSVNDTEKISTADDLPPVEDGFHQLDDMTAYKFTGFVTSEFGIEFGENTPVKGFHGGSSGFIYTGDDIAMKADGKSVFIEDLFISASGATAIDFRADRKDMLIDSVTIADVLETGDIESLGIIEGYRVPVIELSNFEDFKVGLEYRGKSDKIFLFGSPFRNTSAEYAVRLHESVESDFADISRCFFFNFDNSEAPALQIDDPDSVGDGILSQNAFDTEIEHPVVGVDRGDVNWNFDSNTGIQDSKIRGGFTIREERDIEIEESADDRFNGNAYARIPGPVTANSVLERTEVLEIDNGKLRYIGRFDAAVSANLVMTIAGTNDVASIGIFKNDELLEDSVQVQEVRPESSNVTAQVQLDTEAGDEFQVGLANLDSSSDITIRSVNFVMAE